MKDSKEKKLATALRLVIIHMKYSPLGKIEYSWAVTKVTLVFNLIS